MKKRSTHAPLSVRMRSRRETPACRSSAAAPEGSSGPSESRTSTQLRPTAASERAIEVLLAAAAGVGVVTTAGIVLVLLLEAVQFQSPKRSGMFRPKMRYAHQGGMTPPIVVIHGTSLSGVTDSYKRYLEGRFREVFKLRGTPLRIQMNTDKNPYVDADKGKKGKKDQYDLIVNIDLVRSS